jgi:hypothetical protein
MDGGDALDAFDIEGLDADALLEHLVGPDDLAADDLLGSVLELCDNIDDSASADEYADVTAMLLDSLADPANQPPAAEQPACALPGKGTGRGRGGYTHGVRGGKRNMDRASIHEKLQ